MFQIFIDEEEVICDSNINLKEEFTNPSSIILSNVYPKSWKGTDKLLTDYYFPEDYSKCKILRDGKLYFSGVVKNSADMSINPLKPHFCGLQILDAKTLLSEGDILDYVISEKTVEEAILQVIESIADYGFVAGDIKIPEEQNTIIGAYSTLDKAPFDVFQYLALISETKWGTRMIDENTTAIDFCSPDISTIVDTIECEKKYCTNNRIEDIEYSYSTNDYRNKQVIISDEVYAEITQIENILSNGYNQTYTVEQKIGKIESITISGQEKTFTTKEMQNIGLNADFYYETGSNILESTEIYPAGSVVKIQYIPIVKGREVSYNNSEIMRINEKLKRNGTISRYEKRNDVISSKELLSISKTYIKFKGKAEITLTIKSRKDFLEIGKKYYFNSPLNKLNGEYFVKSKQTKITQSGTFQAVKYEYQLTNSFNTENELNYFDNQRSKNKGNISQGEFISRNIDINSQEMIVFSNLKIEELDKVSNILDFNLEMPLEL